MVRISRIVVPDAPHHVTQRGNRNQQVFFSDQDRRNYLNLLHALSVMHDVQIWAYCLMTNHVHIIAVPKNKDGFVRCFQELNQVYARAVNLREGWRGYLWQGRFSSFPMDELHLIAAIRYVECNPVAAHMVEQAEDYAWSSAKAHVKNIPDAVLSACYLLDEIKAWALFLRERDIPFQESMDKVKRTGRPLGSKEFIRQTEKVLGREIQKKKPGPKGRKPPALNHPALDLIMG